MHQGVHPFGFSVSLYEAACPAREGWRREKSPASLGPGGCHGDTGRKRKGLHRPLGAPSSGDPGVKALAGPRAPCHSGAPGCRNGGEGRRRVIGRGRCGPQVAGGEAVPVPILGARVGMLFALFQNNRLSFTDCRASEGERKEASGQVPTLQANQLGPSNKPYQNFLSLISNHRA